jgi:hypothetical protein
VDSWLHAAPDGGASRRSRRCSPSFHESLLAQLHPDDPRLQKQSPTLEMTDSPQTRNAAPPPRRGGPLGIYLTTRERDRDAALGWGSLFIAIIGQMTVFSPLIGKDRLAIFFATVIFMVPWFIVFLLNFTNRPLFPPQKTFRWWLFASCWYAALTIIGEILYFAGYLPIKTIHHTSEDYYIPRALHVLMFVGLLSFIPLIRYLKFHRGQKT